MGAENGYVVKVDVWGNVRLEAFTPDGSLEQLQRAVGGWIERVPIRAFEEASARGAFGTGWGIDCYVDEEGLFRQNPRLNWAISAAARTRIVGDAVLAMHDGEGGTHGIPERLARRVKKFCEDMFVIATIGNMVGGGSAIDRLTSDKGESDDEENAEEGQATAERREA